MKVGISIKIDVTKIDKARLFQGQKGTYLDLTTFVDLDQKDQYDNNGFISQSVTKEEREQNVQTEILGNCRVFYKDGQNAPAPQQNATQQFYEQAQQPAPSFDDSSDIPF